MAEEVKIIGSEDRNFFLRVEHGEVVKITRRRRVVAKIVPIQKSTKAVDWSDLFERLHTIYGKKPVRGKAISELIRERREERL